MNEILERLKRNGFAYEFVDIQKMFPRKSADQIERDLANLLREKKIEKIYTGSKIMFATPNKRKRAGELQRIDKEQAKKNKITVHFKSIWGVTEKAMEAMLLLTDKPRSIVDMTENTYYRRKLPSYLNKIQSEYVKKHRNEYRRINEYWLTEEGQKIVDNYRSKSNVRQ